MTCEFLHAGLLHLLINMVVLAIIGPLVERLYGNLGFAIAYAISGLWASVVSVSSHPMVVAVGASGAIFGLYGALGAALLRQKLPQQVIRRYRGVTIGFVAANLIFGLLDKHIDTAAHVGGLAAGFVVGMALGRPLLGSTSIMRWRRALLVALAGAASIALAVHLLDDGAEAFASELQSFYQTQRVVLARTYDADKRHSEGSFSDAEFIAVLQAEGIDRWGPMLDRIERLKNVPAYQRQF